MASGSPEPGIRLFHASVAIVQRIPPSVADWYLEWQRETTRIAAGFAGYGSTDIFPSCDSATDEWITLFHFQDAATLKCWMDSPERAQRLELLQTRIGDFEVKTLNSGLGAWFARQGKGAAAPPGWKMVLCVVLGLYPTVMLLSMTIGLVTERWGLAVSMLIGNLCSVSILEWGVMPVLTRLLHPWLHANDSKRPQSLLAGFAVALLVLSAMAIAFRSITG